jgi:hypothetical protein
MPNATPGGVTSLVVTAAFGFVMLIASGLMAAQKAVKSAA